MENDLDRHCSGRARNHRVAVLASVLLSATAGAQPLGDPMMDACIAVNGSYNACVDSLHPHATPQRVVLQWAALAISETTLRAGAAHGRTSQDDAEQTALGTCHRGGSSDCKVLMWARNQCLALAVSYPGGPFGDVAGEDRGRVAASALAQCRSRGGKNCVVIVTPCAADDARWSSPLPLPAGTQGASVDPNVVGTWEYSVNPGRRVWRIAANGTYEFHSEAGDNAPSQAGTISTQNDPWSIHAINNGYTDSGTYAYQGAGTLVATGKLGTGTWHRIAN